MEKHNIDIDELIELFSTPWIPAEHKRYLKSHHWRLKKVEYFESRPRACYVCGVTEKIHLHHRTYANIWNEDLDDLITLCNVHHSELHSLQNRFNLMVEDATDVYLACAGKVGFGELKKNRALAKVAKEYLKRPNDDD